MISQNIDRNIYEEVIRSARPVLLCFFTSTIFHSELVGLVEELSRQYESIRFCVVPEEEHEFFFEKFHFGGTPIFIFLAHGNEKGRLLGSVSADRLRAFVERNIREPHEKENSRPASVKSPDGLKM
jgi:hypothetical protein